MKNPRRIAHLQVEAWGVLRPEGLARGDNQATEALYSYIVHRLRPLVEARLGPQEADDVAHEALAIIVENVRKGHVRELGAIYSYSHGVVRRLIAARIVQQIRWRRVVARMDEPGAPRGRHTPESELLQRERWNLLEQLLAQLSARDSELLRRFYFEGQPFRDICKAMQITETQFRLFKSRAKAKLARWATEASGPSRRSGGARPSSD
ncbi:MAG: sigma-70 family RNA polymerase sigma factor [Bryobacteraceae bacterium]|nr:sigma-70 family RNA polymerase sigma factor [Bryobacteraceae bacterium]MDW8378480.1 sigma-70 family RNA polymerase sigma factor [Bryobacterales bacterium]